MIEPRHRPRLVLEAPTTRDIGCELLRQHLDGDQPVQPRIARLVHFAHAACADERDQFIGAEPGSGSESRRSFDEPILSFPARRPAALPFYPPSNSTCRRSIHRAVNWIPRSL